MSDDPLFKGDVNDQLRAVLRTEFGLSEQVLAKIEDKDLAMNVYAARELKDEQDEIRAELPNWIAAGYVTAEQAARMNQSEMVKLSAKVHVLELEQRRKGARRTAFEAAKRAAPETPPELTRNEVLALLAKTVAVVAAQQVAIDELRAQVATLHNYHMAVFGQQQVIEQLTNAPRDFEAVDVLMRLEEQSSTSAESAIVASEQTQGTFESAQNMAAAIEGLASLVAGLNAGRSIDLTELNQATKRLSERSKMHARTRSRGEVRIKIGKVTGGRRDE